LLLDGKKEKAMLEQKNQIQKLAEVNGSKIAPKSIVDEVPEKFEPNNSQKTETKPLQNGNGTKNQTEKNGRSNDELFSNRQSISEVLHEIYDKK